jgi:predicted MFS family arabinose efflux permease
MNAIDSPRRELRDGSESWLRPAAALAAIGWGANVFVPLIVLYQQHGISLLATEVMFGCYAVGLVPALLAGGRWSDRTSRKVVVTTALALSTLASVILLAGSQWHALLFAGRFIAGVSSGLAFGTGAAWIRELSAAHADIHVGARRATIAMTVGFAGGPLISGLIAQWAPQPQVFPYLPHLVLCAAALVLLRPADPGKRAHRAAPVSTDTHPDQSLTQRLATVSLPFGPWIFGTASIGLAYLPAVVAAHAGAHRLAFAAVATALPAFTGVLVQPVVARAAAGRPVSQLLLRVMFLVIVALLGAAWAASAATVWAVFIAASLLGIAYGAALYAGIADIQHAARPVQLGVATSSFQAISYLGFAFPYLLTLAHNEIGWSPAGGLIALVVVAVACTAWLSVSTRTKGAQ